MKFFVENLKRNFEFLIFSKQLAEGAGKNTEVQHTNEQQEELSTSEKQEQNKKAEMQYLKSYGTNLVKGLGKVAEGENPKDPEFLEFKKQIEDKVAKFGEKFTILEQEIQELQKVKTEFKTEVQDYVEANEIKLGLEISETGEVTKMTYSPEDMKQISNSEFLTIPEKQRLQYITKNNIDSDRVANGEVQKLDFTFTFNGEYNKELYLDTTAGQVLPKQVREITEGGKNYIRSGINGEFYNGSQRLIIREGTQIDILKIGDAKELQEIEGAMQEKINVFLEENPKYNTEEYKDVVKQAFLKGLGEKETIFILTGGYEKISEISLEEAKKTLIITRFLKNSGYLDSFDSNNTIKNLEEIIGITKKYGDGLKYSIGDKGITFNFGKDGLPIGVESEPGLKRFSQVALSQLGVTENNGGADKYFSEAGFGNISSKNVPWCAAFINWCLQKSGFKGTKSLAAKSFIESSGYGHVGIKLGDKILGGNQGNKVSLGNIRKPIVGYSIPTTEGLKVYKGTISKDKVPDGAIIVFDRNVKRKQYA